LLYITTGGGLGSSLTSVYSARYSVFATQLHGASSGDATDTAALTSVPIQAANPVTGSSVINFKSANGRALGFNTPGGVVVNGMSYDSELAFNTSITTPGGPGPYSLLAVAEHEIDEALGLGSDVGGTGFFSNPAAEDLFRYTSTPGVRSYHTMGPDNTYFSLDGTTDLVQFNQDVTGAGGDYGDWWSHNGGGNPGPTPPPRVQDAFAFPGTTPTLATDAGSPEIVALDAIGYNLANPASAVPEPSTVCLLGTMALFLTGYTLRRRKQFAGAAAA
jgi:hypothetical protein